MIAIRDGHPQRSGTVGVLRDEAVCSYHQIVRFTGLTGSRQEVSR
jgi:hypothetical protein